ncbi:MAG: DUF2975 domain-containing protein [Lachnospiraceae bacterium]|nr:DUF2975 domain-containing protein [Lachnospiraceae bacterium]
MKHDIFSKWIKVVIIGTALIGVGACVYLVPDLFRAFKNWYPELSNWVMPWMILIYICSVPCFAALVVGWMIADNIGKDQSFTVKNANLFKIFSMLALADSIVFGVGSIVYSLLGINHPGLLIIQLLIVFVGLAIFVCMAALSYLVGKAAVLQEDNDLTV